MSASPEPPLVERQLLARLHRLPGADGQSLASELVTAYLQAFPARILDLHAALAAGDGPTTRRIAHSLRGSAAMLGATSFAALLFAVEQPAEQGLLAQSLTAVAAVEAAWPATAAALSASAAALRDDSRAP